MGRTRKKIENCRLSPANETYNSSHTLGAKKVGKHFDRILHRDRKNVTSPNGYDKRRDFLKESFILYSSVFVKIVFIRKKI